MNNSTPLTQLSPGSTRCLTGPVKGDEAKRVIFAFSEESRLPVRRHTSMKIRQTTRDQNDVKLSHR
ncbi:hypothetical protein ABIB18_003634 [Pantoea sp. UYEF8]